MEQINAPTHCPSCNSALETVNSILYCRNNVCPAQGIKLIENFGKVLKIIGLGPATIRKLELTTIGDLYSYTREEITNLIGQALGNKLYDNIQKSATASLNQVLPALGIPLIGRVASDKICANIHHIDDITEELANSVLGPKAAKSLLDWIETEECGNLPFSFIADQKPANTGASVCITGKLNSFSTKSKAYTALRENGYVIAESLTKSTKYLVNESGIESVKTEKARAYGTIIINNMKELL